MKEFQAAVDRILQDHVHGSGTLTESLLSATEDFLQRHPNRSDPEYDDFSITLSKIKTHLKAFSGVVHFIQTLQVQLSQTSVSTAQLLETVDRYRNQLQTSLDRQVQALESLEPQGQTVLLHSHSTTVISVLTHLSHHNRPKTIIQTESRPLLEGRLQAAELAEAGYSVQIIVDAAVHWFIKTIGLVILGADSIHRDQFTNKIGSAAIICAAREQSIPVYVFADTTKLRLTEPDSDILTGPEADLWKGAPESIRIENPILETTSNRNVTGFILDGIILSPEELKHEFEYLCRTP